VTLLDVLTALRRARRFADHSCGNFYARSWFIRPSSPKSESPNAPTAQNGRASAAASARESHNRTSDEWLRSRGGWPNESRVQDEGRRS
jgi:hypothetical protein